ncbi:uncharacterized protein E0L32_009032 [Thyridium curvatum]|uniref:Uncharacterized protein n=1 Tax=Thyridium curvatum TaxID=1093900 RepID=A0A507APK1_9PEZI|nr:uncharacterized protein E0L32_009032 [Thyridium curvatum]TPX09693.1 hypothetical protein E0L32_009032 [Thyridium curvatum]
MRLLNTSTLKLQDFPGEVPAYAILSHTWNGDEVTFEDLRACGKAGAAVWLSSQPLDVRQRWKKVVCSSRVARNEGFEWIWVDSVCIDKSSSAELSEAINSMFTWYEHSKVCFAFLADVMDAEELEKSAWFTRGFTLQELLAPREMVFYAMDWHPIGSRTDLSSRIRSATNISDAVLWRSPGLDARTSLDRISVSTRMSWAAGRKTTRPEDRSYCLLGLFGIQMPLLYGEGSERAFLRLQEEILKLSEDDTIFAWRMTADEANKKPYWGLLATDPDHFARRDGMEFRVPRVTTRTRRATVLVHQGVQKDMSLIPMKADPSGTIYFALIHAVDSQSDDNRLTTIILQRVSDMRRHYVRICPQALVFFAHGRTTKALEMPPGLFTDGVQVSEQSSEWQGAIQHYVFARQVNKDSTLTSGFYFYSPHRIVCDKAELPNLVVLCSPTQYSMGGEVSEGFHVRHESSTDQPWFSFTLSLGAHTPDWQRKYEAKNVQTRVFLGCLSLRIEWGLGRELRSANVCLAVGLEPLPDNPFGTPAGFVRPWYAFIPRFVDHWSSDIETIDRYLLTEAGDYLVVSFPKIELADRRFYNICFEVRSVEST